MNYSIGDRFIVGRVEGEVRFIDGQGKAYLTSVEDLPAEGNNVYLKGLVFSILDKKGKDRYTGKKALYVHNKECGAV